MLLNTRTPLTPLNFSQMFLPGPLVYLSYSLSFPGRTSNRYSKVIMERLLLSLSARPAGRPLPEKSGDSFLGVYRHGVHRHDLLGGRRPGRNLRFSREEGGLLDGQIKKEGGVP